MPEFQGFNIKALPKEHKIKVRLGQPELGESVTVTLEPADARQIAKRLNEAAEHVLHGTSPPGATRED